MVDLSTKLNNFHLYISASEHYLNSDYPNQRLIAAEVEIQRIFGCFNEGKFAALTEAIRSGKVYLSLLKDADKNSPLRNHVHCFDDHLSERNKMIEPIFDLLVEDGYNTEDLRL